MFALFEDAGKFLAGRILSEAESSMQIELDSGKRVKVKTAHVLLKFDKPAPAELIAEGQRLAAEIDLDLAWEFAASFSVQRVGVHRGLASPGSPVYQAWHERLLAYRGGVPPDYGAIWLTYYPTHMIELYPHALVRSTLHPRGPQETLNVTELAELYTSEQDTAPSQPLSFCCQRIPPSPSSATKKPLLVEEASNSAMSM